MIIRFVEKLDAAGLSQLLKRVEKVGVPAFTLFNKNARKAVSNFELLTLLFEMIYLLKNDVVGGKVALSGGSFKNLLVQIMVKIEFEEVALLNLRSSQYAGAEVSI